MSDETIARACPNCAILELRLAEMEARIAELEARLRNNSSNSSHPPSSDQPWQRPASSKPRSGKKPGGQPGHSGAFRQRLPLNRVNKVVDHIPQNCAHCQASLVGQHGPHLPETSWHQVAELQYVTNVRIHAASEMLKDPNRGIADIARAAGFSTSAFFCETFKRHIGETPTAYRRRFVTNAAANPQA